jgi:hypothetical protein
MENKQQTAELNNFKNSPIHDKKAIIEMMDELEPKEMIEVVEFLKSKINKQMKQTAVEWLVNQNISVDLGSGIKMKIPIPTDIIAQAKEMEKQQIIDAVDGFPLDKRNLDGQEYWKQTYGGNK